MLKPSYFIVMFFIDRNKKERKKCNTKLKKEVDLYIRFKVTFIVSNASLENRK